MPAPMTLMIHSSKFLGLPCATALDTLASTTPAKHLICSSERGEGGGGKPRALQQAAGTAGHLEPGAGMGCGVGWAARALGAPSAGSEGRRAAFPARLPACRLRRAGRVCRRRGRHGGMHRGGRQGARGGCTCLVLLVQCRDVVLEGVGHPAVFQPDVGDTLQCVPRRVALAHGCGGAGGAQSSVWGGGGGSGTLGGGACGHERVAAALAAQAQGPSAAGQRAARCCHATGFHGDRHGGCSGPAAPDMGGAFAGRQVGPGWARPGCLLVSGARHPRPARPPTRVQQVVKVLVVREDDVAAHVEQEALGGDIGARKAAGLRLLRQHGVRRRGGGLPC